MNFCEIAADIAKLPVFEGGRVNFNSSSFANRRKVANFARLFAELCPGGARKALL